MGSGNNIREANIGEANIRETVMGKLHSADKVLVGIGAEWRADRNPKVSDAYGALACLLEGKDYFIVTTNTDAAIFADAVSRSSDAEPAVFADAGVTGEEKSDTTSPRTLCARPCFLDSSRITAPCGNETWRQCSKSCTKDIWEPGEIPDDICPHCGAPLTGNTIHADVYIEEGYLPQWHRYTAWLAGTVNRKLLLLELGEGFQTPTVIRWPFEKTVRYNQKAFLCRVNENFAQLPEGIAGSAVSVKENSVEWLLGFRGKHGAAGASERGEDETNR